MELHFYYNQLSEKERSAVDSAYSVYHKKMKELGVPVSGDDRAERTVDAMSKQVIDSRSGE